MILSLLLCIPLLGMLLVRLFPKKAGTVSLWTSFALAGTGITSLFLFPFTAGMHFVQRSVWLQSEIFDVVYHVGADGISYPLVLLTILLAVVAVLVSRREIHSDEPTYYMLFLGLVASVIGVFTSLHLVIFFIFWEAILVLMFLLILRWGGENKSYAAMRFLIYTGLGSAALLIAIILIGVSGGTLEMLELASAGIPHASAVVIFVLLLFAFFIKIPIVPFHTWLPDAHTQAPTAGSILLAGVLLKMGAYGLLRLGTQAFSDVSASFRIFLFIMGTVTIIYGALVSLAQTNLKRLIAYSSVNHMGIVLLGLSTGSAIGITGAVFEMVSHGLIAALLFALAGLIHERSGTFDLGQLRGLASRMPRTAWILVLACLGGLGLPSMTGFIAEFLVLYASFAAFGLLALVPLSGVILTGAYMVRLITKVALGKPSTLAFDEKDVSLAPFAILVCAIFLLGIAPFLLIGIVTLGVLG